MTEIDDRYMQVMVARIVPSFHPDFEDAMQVARIQRWLYRDHSVSWQINQIKWRVAEMMRGYHGRTSSKLGVITGTALSLSVILPGNYLPLTETVSASDPPLSEHVAAKMDTEARLEKTMLSLRRERVRGIFGSRNVDWILRHARGETMKSIARSVACTESNVCAVIAAIRRRLREQDAA